MKTLTMWKEFSKWFDIKISKKLIIWDKLFNKNKKSGLHIDKEISKTADMMRKISLQKSKKHFLKTISQSVSVKLKTYGKLLNHSEWKANLADV